MKSKLTNFLLTSLIGVSSLGISIGVLTQQRSESASAYTPGKTYTIETPEVYYAGISDSKEGDALLKDLQSLNKSKRKVTVGYSAMGTSPSGAFAYTDYDPAYIAYDSNNQPYGTRILSFYSGASTTSWNREHVWPNSRGGGLVDNDIYMPRPTIAAENSDRGNSAYVEGISHASKGWDPITAFGVNGCYLGEGIRGECARIIFYCMAAESTLNLVDTNGMSGNSYQKLTMGKLSDMLRWNLDYSVNQREINRQSGGQYLQGNRNPFVDHPEYACKIWGNYNSETKKICGSSLVAPTSITIDPSNSTITKGSSIDLTVTVNQGASSQVNWSSSDNTIATVNNGKVTGIKEGNVTITATSALDPNVKGSATITVKTIKSLKLEGTATKTTYTAGQKFDSTGLTITAEYSDSSSENVTSLVKWEPATLCTGLTEVTGKYAGLSVKYGPITVEQGVQETYTLVESTSVLQENSEIVIASSANGMTAGALNNSILSNVATTFSSDKKTINELNSETISYTLKSSGSNTWNLMNEGKKLGCTSEKKLALDAGKTDWVISVNNGTAELTIKDSPDLGTLQYNKSAPRFTTYKSSQTPIELYIKTGGGTDIDEKIHVTDVTLNKTNASLKVGDTLDLVATIAPQNATNKNVTWETSNANVATVTNGHITAISKGNATIMVKTIDGNFMATCQITVVDKDEDIPSAPTPTKNNGCGGSVINSSIVISLLSAAGLLFIAIRKLKVKEN